MNELSDNFLLSMDEFSAARVEDTRAIEMTHLAHPEAVGLSEAHVLIAGYIVIETISVLEGETHSVINSVSVLPEPVTDVRVAFDMPPPFAHYVFTDLADQERFIREVFFQIDYSV